jgi:8-oxo-dGTP pyrophosphatase MutT (NUDIX family)
MEHSTRAAAILVAGGKILLIHRTNKGKEFWVFPGGGVEEGEKVKSAVVREVMEEASIICETTKLLYTYIFTDIDHKQFYYLCKYISGKPKLGDYNEKQTMEEGDQTYEPIWIDIRKLPKLLVYPMEIRDWLIADYANSFIDTPRLKKTISGHR